ncbi:hypothetical protein HY408_01850 [Candidatus Gottesmanbacteria bacterium]|nr:hypothetical protein [Candidatus Gottesmanbacteria bacterium]
MGIEYSLERFGRKGDDFLPVGGTIAREAFRILLGDRGFRPFNFLVYVKPAADPRRFDAGITPDTHLLITISGPDTAGKTTLTRRLNELVPYNRVVTATSRRPGTRTINGAQQREVDGTDYHFISTEAFEEAIKKGELLEHTVTTKGDYYGVPRWALEDAIQGSYPITLVAVDINGALKIKNRAQEFDKLWVLNASILPLTSVTRYLCGVLNSRIRGRPLLEIPPEARVRFMRSYWEFMQAPRAEVVLFNDFSPGGLDRTLSASESYLGAFYRKLQPQ